MVETLTMPSTGRDLSPEAVTGLNEELDAIRGLFNESDVAFNGIDKAKKLIRMGLKKALVEGQVPKKVLGASDILRASADELAYVLGNRVLFGSRATEFIGMLDEFLITKSDGTVLEGSLSPNRVTYPNENERYQGDDKKLPRLYVTGISGLPNYPREAAGRVVSTMYQPYRVRDGGINNFPFGVWVWPNDLDKWTNGSGDGARFVDFIDDPDAQFVSHVEGAKLPKPEDYDPRYQIGID